VAIDRVAAAAQTVRASLPLHFIFHSGHVGSTLVSRLLEDSGATLSLREPLPLRVLAAAHDLLGGADSLLSEAQFETLLSLFSALWRRGYDSSRAVMLKATSSGARISGPLLTRREDSRAICLNLRPEPYLATLLAGQNSPADLRGHAAERMRRMTRLLALERPTPLHALSLGELAAMSWLTETATQHDMAQCFGARVMRFDFDAVLADVPGSVAAMVSHFALPHHDRFLAEIGRSAALTRYAKAPEHAYTPDLRRQILDEARRVHGGEIRRGLAWLENTARSSSAAAGVLQAGG
jgi:hypothetical protein